MLGLSRINYFKAFASGAMNASFFPQHRYKHSPAFLGTGELDISYLTTGARGAFPNLLFVGLVFLDITTDNIAHYALC